MPGRLIGRVAMAALLLSGSGCCSFWERHCAPAHPVAPLMRPASLRSNAARPMRRRQRPPVRLVARRRAVVFNVRISRVASAAVNHHTGSKSLFGAATALARRSIISTQVGHRFWGTASRPCARMGCSAGVNALRSGAGRT